MVPRIRRHAQQCFRKLRPELREELIAEVIAAALASYARLVERGREDLAFPSPLAKFALAQVRQGRQVGNRLSIRDVSSRYAQQRKGFQVERLDQFDATDSEWKEVLVEDRRANPAELAASRIDFAAWFRQLSSRCRRIANFLARGESTFAAARQFALSPARISQLRRELHASWLAFHGEPVTACGAAA
jgi:hypothetical protein